MNKSVTIESADKAAIAKLEQDFQTQKAAFLTDMYPSAEVRAERVLKICDMFRTHRHDIQRAMDVDYGNHPTQSSDIFEIAGIIHRAEWFAKNLEKWMKPRAKSITPLAGNSKAYIKSMPKGVIGNMSPWNFPIEIAVGPLIDILAAGNRAILKPSEVTPNCAALLQSMVAETFEPDLVTTAVGGLELAQHFSKLRWDHLVYTGNSTVARLVMENCARNLVPVTLELGGKSPVIVDKDRVDAETARLIMGLKATRRGQVCVNVDYIMVPEGQETAFVDLLKADIQNGLEADNAASHACSIVNDNHYNRLQGLLEEVQDRGATVIPVGNPDASDTRNMPFTIVLNPPLDSKLMANEIFGPILPILTYKTRDEAIAHVNAGDHPLGLYVFSKDPGFVDTVVHNTRSGGVSVNSCGGQVQTEMGFGGVGESGMGRHHGEEGFHEFSNPRGVFELGKRHMMDLVIPPYGEGTNQLIAAAFGERKAQVSLGLRVLGMTLKNKLGL